MEEIQQQELESSTTSSNGCNFFTCEICVQIVPVNRQFKSMEMSGCLHPYCTDCVAKYIQEKVIEHNMSEIKCANPDCNVMLDASLCQSSLPNGVFEKWCRVLCEAVVLLESSKGGVALGRSYCPYRDSSELILNESNCPNCKQLFCFHCMIPWKENHRCRRHETVIDIDSGDVLFMEMVKRKRLVRCPNCFRYVERNGGCLYIHCSLSEPLIWVINFVIFISDVKPNFSTTVEVCVCKDTWCHHRFDLLITLFFIFIIVVLSSMRGEAPSPSPSASSV
ncbi:hypothetical protein MKW92_036240 [Papaver armeniacum]|nr:hypothetical protein MKW92_036240 [Papaver armeniacum]